VGKSWRTVDEFVILVREALSRYKGRVVVEVVTETLDFKTWLEADGVLNKSLALFSRHGPSNFHPGMHIVRYVRHRLFY